MAVDNSDCIVEFASGVVYEVRIETQEDFAIDSRGNRTITVERSLITTQTAEKQDITATAAYEGIVAPFQIDEYPFYVSTLSLRRVNHVYGRRETRETGESGMVPVARWVCSVTYETSTSVSDERNEEAQRKTDQHPVITWTSNRFDRATTSDVFGRAYRNTAGDFFDGISRPAEERVYSVTVNVPVRRPEAPTTDLISVMTAAGSDFIPKSHRVIADELNAIHEAGIRYEPYYTDLFNYTNNAPVAVRGTEWPVNTLRVASMQVGEVQVDLKEVYFTVEFTLVGRPWGWHREVANRGMNEIEWTIPAGLFHTEPELPYATASNDTNKEFFRKRRVKPYVFDPRTATANEIAAYMDLTVTRLYNHIYQHAELYTAFDSSMTKQERFDEMEFVLLNFIAKPLKVPVTDIRGKQLPQPVFLDGYGQANNASGIADGLLGSVTMIAQEKVGNASFNVFDYLGSRLEIEGSPFPFYVPATLEQWSISCRAAGVAEATIVAETNARATNILPLLLDAGQSVPRRVGGFTGRSSVGLNFFKPRISQDLDVMISPGITMNFQDYRGADLTALPGVYAAPTN